MLRSKERRKAPRHETVRRPARFGWWADDVFEHVRGGLNNLSSRGAALVVAAPPSPTPQWGWFCVSGRSADEWVRARVVAVARGSKGHAEIRLAFDTPCPNQLFHDAVWGEPAVGDHSPREGHEEGRVVPPRRPEPVADRPPGSNPRPDRNDEAGPTAEFSNWLEVREQLRARRHARHLPLILTFGMNLVVIAAITSVVVSQFDRLEPLRVLLEALNRP